ncbi:cystathionine gamma-synthase [Litorimonas sp. WD9-15]|uniref:cystathionine gamma-synthase n=1 Tax=Litorimonas sp. WD9-15 TaxID=3418716 RepID=UPI003D016178
MTDPKTKIVQAQIGADPAHGSVPPPLYLSSTYLWPSPSEKGIYDYGRTNNPNRDGLAETLAELDGGAGAVVTSSGMSALDLTLNLIQADDLVIAPHDCYGGTHRLLTHRAEQGRIRVEFIDQSDEKALQAALAKSPALVMIESPSNPLMRVVDVKAICAAVKAAGAISVVDNTFLSPLRLRPFDLGADIAVQSTTKYINGHSDIIGGCVVAKSEDHAEKLAWWANCTGVTASAFDCHQTLRGLRTLALRLDAAEANATAIAKFLDTQSQVKTVYSPALPSHPQYKIIQAQQSGPGAMLSFEIEGGLDAATQFCEALSIFKLAASLGGVESLICVPETMTHRGMAESARREAGISDGLLRLSVGIEAIDDLLADLTKGFSAVS